MARKRRTPTASVQIGEYRFTKRGIRRFDLRDPYHLAITLSWPQFLAAMLVMFLVVNMLFAALYVAKPGALANAHPGSIADAFFFSIETLATVGYGEIYPGSLYGHIISSTEIVCGMALTAIVTGLMFVRFSRPRAKFIFPSQLVVSAHNGIPTLMIRVGNGRANAMGATTVRMNVLMSNTSSEGRSFRTALELRLVRGHIPIFPLTWTIMHEIDVDSPLNGFDSAMMVEADARIFVTMESRDPMLGATVHDLRSFAPADVAFGMRYVDVISNAEDGTPEVDLTNIGAIEPDEGYRQLGAWDEPV